MAYEPVTIREAAQVEVLLFVGLAFVGALGVIFWGFQTYQFGRIIRDTPTEKVRSLSMGRTEVQGNIIPTTSVYDQPFTEGQCVYYEYKVKEYKEDSDDDGKSWQTIESNEASEPFYVDDGTGQILVNVRDDPIYEISDERTTEIEVSSDPPPKVREFLGMDSQSTQASLDIGEKVWNAIGSVTSLGDDEPADDASTDDAEAAETGDPGETDAQTKTTPGTREENQVPPEKRWEDVEYVTRDEIGSCSNTRNKRRYIQRVLPLGDEVYVYGGTERADVGDDQPFGESVTMQTDPSTDEFIISDMGEFSLARGYTKRSLLYIIAGIIASVIVLAILAQILVTGPIYGPEAAKPALVTAVAGASLSSGNDDHERTDGGTD